MPYVNVYVDDDEVLEAMTDDELIEVMNARGYGCYKDGGANNGEYPSVEHLLDCGLVNEAKAEALLIVGKALGRAL